MRTHERTHQTLIRAIGVGVVVSCLLALLGCKSPVQPDAPSSPNEVEILRLTQCWADYHKLKDIAVYFSEDARMISCGLLYPKDRECPAFGWSQPGSGFVTYSARWLRGEYGPVQEMDWTAGHEVCHQSGIWSEGDADDCNRKAHALSSC